jgi:outer membrane protein TolC
MRKLFILFALTTATATAQQLTLQDVLNLTLKNNFDIQIAQHVAEINKINNHIGTAGGLPVVTGTLSDQESAANLSQKLNTGLEIKRNGATVNTLNANVTASMLLYNDYRVKATKAKLDAFQKQSEELLQAQIQNTLATVLVRYYTIVRQQTYIKTLGLSIELSKKQLEIVQAKKGVGLANDADLFQSQIDLNTRQQDLQAQQLVLAQAQTDLLNVMKLKPDAAIAIKDTIIIDKQVNLAGVLDVINQNPQILSLDEQIKIYALIEKETEALRYPSLRANAGLNYGRTNSSAGQLLLNQSYGPFVSLGLSVPIYNGGNYKRQQQTDYLNSQIAKIQKDNTVLDFQSAAYKTFQVYSNSLTQIATQQNTFDLASKLVSLSLQRFQLASATIVELREAQKSFEEAGFRLVDLSYTAKLAEIELKRVSGKLGVNN